MFVHLWLPWVCTASRTLSLVAVSRGCSLVAVCGLFIVGASLVAELGLWSAQALVVAAQGLREGDGDPPQSSCLENPMDGGAWWAAVHGVSKSRTRLHFHFHFSLSCIGEGNGKPLQCSCLENPRDGGAWRAAICGLAQSRTRLKRLSSSSSSTRTR